MLPPVQTFEVRPELAAVPRLNELLSEQWALRGLPPELEMPVCLVLEELLSNVIRHGGEPGRDLSIEVEFHFEPNAFMLEISDSGKPFDPSSLPPPDLRVPLKQRRAGGMGVMLVKKIADELRYEFRSGRNRVRFRKNF